MHLGFASIHWVMLKFYADNVAKVIGWDKQWADSLVWAAGGSATRL